jgi:hypothetical protein
MENIFILKRSLLLVALYVTRVILGLASEANPTTFDFTATAPSLNVCNKLGRILR